MKKMFTLTIIDNGRTFSAGNLTNFSKGDGKAEGSGKLFEEKSAGTVIETEEY